MFDKWLVCVLCSKNVQKSVCLQDSVRIEFLDFIYFIAANHSKRYLLLSDEDVARIRMIASKLYDTYICCSIKCAMFLVIFRIIEKSATRATHIFQNTNTPTKLMLQLELYIGIYIISCHKLIVKLSLLLWHLNEINLFYVRVFVFEFMCVCLSFPMMQSLLRINTRSPLIFTVLRTESSRTSSWYWINDRETDLYQLYFA